MGCIHPRRASIRQTFFGRRAVRIFYISLLLVQFLPGWSTTVEAETPVGTRQPHTLVYARIGTDPREQYPPTKRMVDHVAARLRQDGIERGEALLAKDGSQLLQWMQSGRADWVTVTPMLALKLQQQAQAKWLLRRWKNGVSEYRTLFITRKESPIQTLTDLRGGRVALENASSTSGFLLPVAAMQQHALLPVPLTALSDALPAEKTGYWFSGSVHSTAARVAKGTADAGAISDQEWLSDEMPEILRRELRIFYQTDPVPRSIEVVRPDLPAELQRHLQEYLLRAHEDVEAIDILKAFENTTRFDRLPDQAMAILQEVDAALQRVQSAARP
ncbi:MAG: phosphate/phosphite/phosphonate ABC transporter substrate-binding protein [Magnetococcus sp. YQC-3]